MNANEVLAGLIIIEKCRPQNESVNHIRAEHDRIYAGGASYGIPESQQAILRDLGWIFDQDVDGWVY